MKKRRNNKQQKTLRVIEIEDVFILIISLSSLVFSFLSWLNTVSKH
jgi:hypothetical protein